MTSTYYQAAGILKLERITPVIQALFGPYNVELMAEGKASIVWASEPGDWCETVGRGTWGEVMDNLLALANQLALPVVACGVDEGLPPVFHALSDHFNLGIDERNTVHDVHQRETAGGRDWDQKDAPVDDLFALARLFDDGHGLLAVDLECAVTSSTLAPRNFWGYASFSSEPFEHYTNTTYELQWAEDLRRALASKDTAAAVERMAWKTTGLLRGIKDEGDRATITKGLIAALQNDLKTPIAP